MGNPKYNTDLFTFDYETGVLTINYVDDKTPSLSGEKFTLILRGDAAKSPSSSAHRFTVTFISQCSDVALTPPVLQEPQLEVYVWKTTFIFFQKPTAIPQDCADFTYKLFAVANGVTFTVDPSLYTISPDASVPQIEFTIPDRNPWLTQYKTFDLQLEATYGSFGKPDTNPSVEITVLEPCFDTQITPQFIRQLTTFVNAPNPSTRTFERFENSVDRDYRAVAGATSDLCGIQEYAIFELIGNEQVPSDLVAVDPVTRRLTLTSDDEADLGLHDMVL